MAARIVFFSDFVCPFCYVAERGVLRKIVDAYDVELEWSGFQLHPRTPKGGATMAELFGAERAPQMKANTTKFAADFGVTMNHPERMPNTRRPLAVAAYAQSKQRLTEMRDAFMDAHWQEGKDIESDAVIGECAVKAGLDRDAAIAAAASRDFQDRVDTMGALAQRWGVSGIPTYFILPDGWSMGDPPLTDGRKPTRIVGCQPPHIVENAVRQAGIARR